MVGGNALQIMHGGTKVVAGGYHWMADISRNQLFG